MTEKKERIRAGGRPKSDFDKKQFETLCGFHCTMQEICYFFKTTDKTLTRWCKRVYDCCFSDAYKIYNTTGKISLRRLQFRHAEKSAVMCIWLGKQYLNQKDHQHMNDENATSKVLTTMTIVNKLVDDQ